jgi:hypothetical protein
MRCRATGVPPAILLGLKGIGKSTAFKILTSEQKKEFLVGGFSPGGERFRSLPHVQPGLFRERFYALFLITILSIVRENVEATKANAKQKSDLSIVLSKVAPFASSIRKNAGRLKGVTIAGFGATFDLSGNEHSALDRFDKESAGARDFSVQGPQTLHSTFHRRPRASATCGRAGE